jgi:2'-5' RNA ligase
MTALVEEIRTDPEKLFFYVRLPTAVKERLSGLAKQIGKGADAEPEENDHITLLYIPRFKEPITEEMRQKIVTAAKEIAAKAKPIKANLQGFAYFDGAEGDDNNPATALVGLIDAPGLANIHVALYDRLKDLGINVEQKHGFTPHTTFAYLSVGARVEDLPVIKESFLINGFEMANDKVYKFPMGKFFKR